MEHQTCKKILTDAGFGIAMGTGTDVAMVSVGAVGAAVHGRGMFAQHHQKPEAARWISGIV